MKPEKLDSYVLDLQQERNFFTLSQQRYMVITSSDPKQTSLPIVTYDPKKYISEGIFYRNPQTKTARIIAFPGTSLEKFMQRHFWRNNSKSQ